MNPALDSVPGGVLSLSEDLRIVDANRGVGEMVGRAPATLVGQLFDTLLSPPSRILFQTHVYPALRADGRVEEVFLTLAAAAEAPSVPVLLNGRRVEGPGRVAYEILIVRIQARARWEQDLLAATRALEREKAASEQLAAELRVAARDLAERQAEKERNERLRDAFVGVLGHELRTPITTIFGMSDVLSRRHVSMDSEAVGRHLADITSEADRLRRLTEDLLVLSRSDGPAFVLASDPLMLGHQVPAIVRDVQARVTDHDFTVEANPGLPVVLGDEPYVEQVVRNLLSNAAKYSPAGTTVRIGLADEDDGVAVRVIDEGPGFGDEPPDRLFEVFYRSPGVARKTSGAGIGLFVCHELIQGMGGRIWAAPAPPPAAHGAEFGFWLPVAPDGDALDDAG